MSAREVESFWARLLAERELRARFLAEPVATALAAGLDPEEARELAAVDPDGLAMAGASFDAKRRETPRRFDGRWVPALVFALVAGTICELMPGGSPLDWRWLALWGTWAALASATAPALRWLEARPRLAGHAHPPVGAVLALTFVLVVAMTESSLALAAGRLGLVAAAIGAYVLLVVPAVALGFAMSRRARDVHTEVGIE